MSLGWFGITGDPRYNRYQKTYGTKTPLPTEFRTRKHKCSQCNRRDAEKIKVSDREYRWLCPDHIIQFNRRLADEKPNFVKASKLGRNS